MKTALLTAAFASAFMIATQASAFTHEPSTRAIDNKKFNSSLYYKSTTNPSAKCKKRMALKHFNQLNKADQTRVLKKLTVERPVWEKMTDKDKAAILQNAAKAGHPICEF